MRITSSTKETQVEFSQQHWDALMTRYPPGTPVSGTVTACAVFGVFIQLDELPDVPALLELTHFRLIEAEPGRWIQFPAEYPAVGSRIEARVLGWCLKPKDVRLTQLSDLERSHERWLAEEAAQPGAADVPITVDVREKGTPNKTLQTGAALRPLGVRRQLRGPGC
jgi:hypothetical protein